MIAFLKKWEPKLTRLMMSIWSSWEPSIAKDKPVRLNVFAINSLSWSLFSHASATHLETVNLISDVVSFLVRRLSQILRAVSQARLWILFWQVFFIFSLQEACAQRLVEKVNIWKKKEVFGKISYNAGWNIFSMGTKVLTTYRRFFSSILCTSRLPKYTPWVRKAQKSIIGAFLLFKNMKKVSYFAPLI